MADTSFDHHDTKAMLDRHYDKREMYFRHQKLDHLDPGNKEEYPQRFYKISKHFRGPGHPILLILGGEDILELPVLHPWVNTGLAKKIGAFVLNSEHRFYGQSQPVKDPSNDQLVKYLTPDQALLDAILLIQATREALGCSFEKSSKDYCPVITFGGSYPGFLSAMMRFRFPDIMDISYAASAPLKLYSQTVAPEAYFDKVTKVAEGAVAGCADAVHDTILAAQDELLSQYTSVEKAAKATGFCAKTFPAYIQDIPKFISETITYLIPAVFADFNMTYYPPGPKAALERACHIFEDSSLPPLARISEFYDLRGEVEYGLGHKPGCFDLSLELPDGPNSRIRGADTSDSGDGFTGEIWQFQCCKDLIIRTSYSDESIFIPRPFSFDWLTEHCTDRFEDIPVDRTRMVRQWGFDDLSDASRILFTERISVFIVVRNEPRMTGSLSVLSTLVLYLSRMVFEMVGRRAVFWKAVTQTLPSLVFPMELIIVIFQWYGQIKRVQMMSCRGTRKPH